ncbi:hypothetical protein [Streptomyces sp. NPDC050804]|uniref:hypothetical protein n=1 Tax=Streptomyces sp. NPDC050804 TaxID=3154745 RepID=UPI003430F920
MPALPSWLTEPLRHQFAVLLPERPEYHPDHPLGCHRRRISDRITSDKMPQPLRFGCSYEAIADTTCSATTIRSRRDEWIRPDVFARPKQIASRRRHVERTHAWQNAFHRLARCYERRAPIVNAFFDLTDTIITVRSLIRRAWMTHRWDERPNRRP